MIEKATPADLEIIAAQLGRLPRGVLGVAARCGVNSPEGHPAVIATAARLPGGEPFPTFYYLTCPDAVAAASHLEANGVMREAESLLENPEIAAAYRQAHAAYIADREAASAAAGVEQVPEIAGVSAGGMPQRVKCFHALLGHALAAGPGVNPIGDWVRDRLAELPPDHPHHWTMENCTWRRPEETMEGDK